ncbi:MAG: hypothetical protein WDO73_00985 [Ignavibacteriota bacterium]
MLGALYAGVPCGAMVGFAVMKFAGAGGSPHAAAVPSNLHAIQTGAGIALLVGMMVTGVVLARSRQRQVQDLNDKLQVLQTDL